MTMASTAYSGTIDDSPWSNVGGPRKNNSNKDSEKRGGAATMADEISPFEKRLNETVTSRAGGAGGDPNWDDAVRANVNAFDSLSIPQQQQHLEDAESSCRIMSISCAVHIWRWTDFIFGGVWGLYGLALLLRRESSSHEQSQSQPHTPKLVIALAVTLATLLWTRFVAASLSLSTVLADMLVYRRLGLLVSACIAPILSLVYVTMFGIVAAAGRGNVIQYLHQYHHVLCLPNSLTRLLGTTNRFHGLLVVLLLLAITECIQWQVYQQYRHYLLRKDAFELLHPPAPTTPTTNNSRRHRDRPWWWQSSVHGDTTLTRHLLLEDGYDANADVDGQANANGQPRWALPARFRTPTRSSSNSNSSHWWWFHWKDQDAIDGHDDNARDDGSVDFASVQEEWASRTEEDPFWWSRPEDEHVGDNSSHRADVSWAKDIKDDEGGRGDASNPK